LNFDLSEKEKELAYVSQKTKYLYVIYILAGLGLLLLIFLISRQRKISKMTREIHEIQTNFVHNKMKERDALRSKNSSTSSFTMTKTQDAKIKE
jgi:cell division protein FtsL